MSDDEYDFTWTCGSDNVSHRRHIDNGAVGEVHEVSLFVKFQLISADDFQWYWASTYYIFCQENVLMSF
jgi:hypothetical protein